MSVKWPIRGRLEVSYGLDVLLGGRWINFYTCPTRADARRDAENLRIFGPIRIRQQLRSHT